MFYRLLGKFFLYFFVIPSIVRSVRFAAPIAANAANAAILDIMKKEERARSRRNHPAGSRLPTE